MSSKVSNVVTVTSAHHPELDNYLTCPRTECQSVDDDQCPACCARPCARLTTVYILTTSKAEDEYNLC